jgi:hypothetical protein
VVEGKGRREQALDLTRPRLLNSSCWSEPSGLGGRVPVAIFALMSPTKIGPGSTGLGRLIIEIGLDCDFSATFVLTSASSALMVGCLSIGDGDTLDERVDW